MSIKQRSAKILAASMLLMTFILGQVIVIVHSHKQTYASHQSQSKKDNTDEKCKTCSQSNHTQLFYQQHQELFSLAVISVNCYVDKQNSYYSVRLQQSSNRGPPLS